MHVQCVPPLSFFCAVTSLPIKCHHTHIHVCATHVPVLSCCVVFCLHLFCSLNVYHPCHTYVSLQLFLIIHHMHHSACFTCYIFPHIPCYMSTLFSTCYLSVSTIQHIHQTYMYVHASHLHTFVICCLLHNKKKECSLVQAFRKCFACTQ